MRTKTGDLEHRTGSDTPEQRAAMRRSRELGRKLQLEIPDIAEDYSNRGMSLSQIVSFPEIISSFK